ncbi:MAG TPA: hypothetical protein VK430_12095 [Xanthobacteraceae bacterium]|nr:hypothetical protein [Xanthobacteraceae bacterium]
MNVLGGTVTDAPQTKTEKEKNRKQELTKTTRRPHKRGPAGHNIAPSTNATNRRDDTVT